MNKAEGKELRKLLEIGNTFVAEIRSAPKNLFDKHLYQVVFITKGGAEFIWTLQNRVDRGSEGKIREFKTIESAVKCIKSIGYVGNITRIG